MANKLQELYGQSKNKLGAMFSDAMSDYSRLPSNYPNAQKFMGALSSNISKNIPTTQEFRNPAAMSGWAQSVALNAPMGLSTKLADYVGYHTAPMYAEGGETAALHELDKLYPADIYSSKAAQYYGHGVPYDKESIAIMHKVKNKPDELVTIYRAVPTDVKENTVNIGDWITLSPSYAKEHGEAQLGGDYKIIKQKVPAKTLFTNADSIHELGYDPTPYIKGEK